LPSRHVQPAAYAVTEIDWLDHRIKLDVIRDPVKSSPASDPLTIADLVEIVRQLGRSASRLPARFSAASPARVRSGIRVPAVGNEGRTVEELDAKWNGESRAETRLL
jgi:hypothetical protein